MRASFARLLKVISPGMGNYEAELSGRQQFSFKDIIRATKNFDSGLLLREGAFGKVYKVHTFLFMFI